MEQDFHLSQIPSNLSLPFELIALQNATHYQQWMIQSIKPYLGKRILELGAGIGNMSRWLASADYLLLTESDPQLLELLKTRLDLLFPNQSHIQVKTLDIAGQSFTEFARDDFDTIVSFNVLEHIEDDTSVIKKCAELLRASHASGKKRLITFIPAHPWAYGAMDKAVGHYRRYNQKMFRALHQKTAPEATLTLKAFNFVGLWGWYLNGYILRRKQAGSQMIGWVDTACPLFQWIDRLVIDKLHIPLGQSLIAILEWS